MRKPEENQSLRKCFQPREGDRGSHLYIQVKHHEPNGHIFTKWSVQIKGVRPKSVFQKHEFGKMDQNSKSYTNSPTKISPTIKGQDQMNSEAPGSSPTNKMISSFIERTKTRFKGRQVFWICRTIDRE